MVGLAGRRLIRDYRECYCWRPVDVFFMDWASFCDYWDGEGGEEICVRAKRDQVGPASDADAAASSSNVLPAMPGHDHEYGLFLQVLRNTITPVP